MRWKIETVNKKIREDEKLQEVISYLFFGGMTTVVNFIVFF
ncbi:hypothetical protein TMUPMC115_1596 [Tetragenococcus muriaticus PMC-11-5]|uniref:Uncharacterized protein n=1 Tax=Tetragenococcus muriaticus PMC-11-5 TaxID=1302649 RepID=A0A091C342_9ENTE|nr:hypothetical protein TMUPMC115_1596 [Tetragenococcus muriaticus PMC-11-5]